MVLHRTSAPNYPTSYSWLTLAIPSKHDSATTMPGLMQILEWIRRERYVHICVLESGHWRLSSASDSKAADSVHPLSLTMKGHVKVTSKGFCSSLDGLLWLRNDLDATYRPRAELKRASKQKRKTSMSVNSFVTPHFHPLREITHGAMRAMCPSPGFRPQPVFARS